MIYSIYLKNITSQIKFKSFLPLIQIYRKFDRNSLIWSNLVVTTSVIRRPRICAGSPVAFTWQANCRAISPPESACCRACLRTLRRSTIHFIFHRQKYFSPKQTNTNRLPSPAGRSPALMPGGNNPAEYRTAAAAYPLRRSGWNPFCSPPVRGRPAPRTMRR